MSSGGVFLQVGYPSSHPTTNVKGLEDQDKSFLKATGCWPK